jgi:aquaporin Z
VNPARSISQAIFASDYLSQVWLFIAAPIAGGQLAGLVYPWLTEKE